MKAPWRKWLFKFFVGDHYVPQNGIVRGPGSSNTQVDYSKRWEEIQSGLGLQTLANVIKKLQAQAELDSSSEGQDAGKALGVASVAAEKGNGGKVLRALADDRDWIADRGTDVTAKVIVGLIKD
jgi:hypothetical protein